MNKRDGCFLKKLLLYFNSNKISATLAYRLAFWLN
jgi:hypothetical protein